jgi:8-oxo-dGTP diphosphatase
VSRFLVRHAKAGRRADWKGEDRDRPLSKAGHRQAAGLADRLAGADVKELWSSPYVRCVQTLEPLAERVGLPINTEERLAEGTPVAEMVELMRGANDGAVFSTHGDLFTDVIEALAESGTEVATPLESRKGSVWILDGDGSSITRAAAIPPPDDRPGSVG